MSTSTAAGTGSEATGGSDSVSATRESAGTRGACASVAADALFDAAVRRGAGFSAGCAVLEGSAGMYAMGASSV
jgi:hypothetical protein